MPSIIARPYSLAVKDTPQRKDFQRFLLENTVSFMATVAVSSVVEIFERIKNSDNQDTAKLNKIREALIIDLDRMALGTWCRVLRETVDKVLSQESRNELFIPEICEFYATKSKIESTINNLVTIRNKDAHGNPIPEDKLKQELDKRQEMLDKVMEELAFLENYRLLVLESFEVSETGNTYNGKEFSGDGYVSVDLSSNLSLPLNTPILFKKDSYLSLAPLCIYTKIDGEDETHVAIFSKILNAEGSSAEYLNIGGHSTVNLPEFDAKYGCTYLKKYDELHDIYSDPTNEPVANVDINTSLKVSDKSLMIGEEGKVTFELFNTKKSTPLNSVSFVIDFPDSFDLEILEYGNGDVLIDKQTHTVCIKYDTILENQKEAVELLFSPTEQGAYSIRPGIFTGYYWRKESDKDKSEKNGGGQTELNVDIPLASIEVKDPNSQNVVCPIINAKKCFSLIGEESNDFEIGKKFLFELTLENIGLSSAYSVQLEVVFPKYLELVDGIESITTSLNPGENRTFKYSLSTKQPGIYNIIVCDIRYYDIDGNKYITQLNDDFRILVKSNIEKELRYFIEDAYSDLFLDDEEKTYIDLKLKKYDVLSEELLKQARFDALVTHIRDLVKLKCKNKNINVTESVYIEDKRNLNRRNKTRDIDIDTPRKSLVFSINECPFFAINLTNPENIEFYGYDSLAKRIYGKYIKDSSYILAGPNYELTNMLHYNDIEYLEADGKQKLGRALFSTWIDKTVDSLLQTQLRLKNFAEILGNKWHIKFNMVSDSEMYATTGEYMAENSGFYQNEIFLLRNICQEGDRGTFIVVLTIADSIKEYIDETIFDMRNISFMHIRGNSENLYSEYLHPFFKSDKFTRYIAYEVTPKDDFDTVLENLESVRIAILKAYSYSLLNHQSIADCRNIDMIKDEFETLFQAGVAFRVSENKKSIEAYSYQLYMPDEPKYHSCLGFITSSGKNLRFYVKFFNRTTLSDEERSFIEINSRFYTNDIVRSMLFMIDLKQNNSSDAVRTALKIIQTAAINYQADKIQIIPDQCFDEYFIGYCRVQPGLPVLVNTLYDNDGSLDVTPETEFSIDRKEINKTLRRFKEHTLKYYLESIFIIKGTKDCLTVSLAPTSKLLIDAIKKENPALDFCEAGDPAKIREYINYFKKCHPVLADSTTSPTWCANRLPYTVWGFDSYFVIGIGSKTISALFEIKDTNEKGEEILNYMQQYLPEDIVSEIRYSGRQNQHVKVSGPVYEHNNYENFLDEEWSKSVYYNFGEVFKYWDHFLNSISE